MELPTPNPPRDPPGPPGKAVGFAFAYPDLPIMAGREAIIKALSENQTLVVQGGTGSGKTTQLPKFLLEAGYSERGLIGMTQPRRIAALSITDRLRQETQQPHLIGSKIRFLDDVPAGARVKVMTDGILLQEFRRDPLLRRYSCIILDEAHERSLNVDILLGILKQILPRRKDFRLVVTSATLDAQRFSEYLGKAPIVEVEGRQYPVTIEYWDPQGGGEGDDPEGEETPSRAIPPVEAAYMAIRDLQRRRPDNLLCFLPTEKEINELHRELERDMGKAFAILPLYSRLGPADQKKVFQESHLPKIILATNIAETSLTIPGIGYVVDTGLARISRYHPQTKIQGLPIERISQASARQRAGRAGRVKAGVCIRLYGEAEFSERAEFTEPEILRSNLANVVLQLLALGLSVENFPFPDPPVPAALKGAFRQLHELGAVDGPGLDAALTEEGLKLSRLPVDVALGKILLKASDFNCLPPALILAAGVTIQDPRFLPKEEPDRGKAALLHRRFEDPRSDFIGLLALWIWIHKEWDSMSQGKLRRLCLANYLSYNRVREWMDLAEQFARLLKVTSDSRAIRVSDLDPDAIHKAILAGFLPFLARKKPEDVSYRLAGDKEAFIHPGSSLGKRKPEWIVAGEVRQTSRTFIYRACEIKPAWVEEIAPDACKRAYFNIAWNPDRGFVEAVERLSYKGFVLRQDRRVNYESVAPEECAEIFWREGVIRGSAGAPFPFRDKNQAVLDALAALERKVRVRGLVPDEDALAHWYRERAPEVTSRIRLERFLRGLPVDGDDREGGNRDPRGSTGLPGSVPPGLPGPASKEKDKDGDGRLGPPQGGSQPPAPAGALPRSHTLEFSIDDWAAALASIESATWLPTPAAASGKTWKALHPLQRLFPDALEHVGRRYPLSYRFDFGDPGDGITVETDLEGLASLSLPALFHGIPGWRAWIWDWAMEKLPAKVRQQALDLRPDLAKAWLQAIPSQLQAQATAAGSPAADASDPVPSPASALALLLADTLESIGLGLTFPATWPSYLSIHILVKSANGRRFLMHADPSAGDTEWFAAARRLAFGETAMEKSFEDWTAWAMQNFGLVPTPLTWRGLAFGALIPGSSGVSGNTATPTAGPGPRPAPACGFFSDLDEAVFHRNLVQTAPAFSLQPEAARKPLASFFAKRLQSILDAWSTPDKFRKETAALRDNLAASRLPGLFLDAYGHQDALLRAEKETPPTRATLPKAGSQVKTLSALGQAVTRGQDSGNWTGAALALHAAWLSREAFASWYVFFAQPPLSARADINDILREVTSLKGWEEILTSPYHSAWAVTVLQDRIPGDKLQAQTASEAAWTPPEPGGLETLGKRWEKARAREEAIRKGSKGLRDRFAGRFAALGQAPGGLPQELRDAMETLDKGGPWGPKAQAAIALELHLNRTAGRAGGAGVKAVSGAKPDPVAVERKDQLIKGLSGRFKKL